MQLGLKPGETSADGLVTIEEVKCLAACDRAPMFQAQIGDEVEYHENQTVCKDTGLVEIHDRLHDQTPGNHVGQKRRMS